MPPAEPGTVRVFGVNGAYISESRPEGFDQRLLRVAESVSYVDVTARTLEVGYDLPPDRRLLIGFLCQVRDPEVVAKSHVTNLFPELNGFLSRIPWPSSLPANATADDYGQFQRRTIDLINLRPPVVRGIRATLAYVHLQLS